MPATSTAFPTRAARVSFPILLATCVLLAGCSTTSTSAGTKSPLSKSSVQLNTLTTNAANTPQTNVKPASLTPPSGLGFTPASAAPGISTTTLDGGQITLMWMDPQRLKFRFIPGYKWPENSPTIPADHNPTSWTSTMLAAFNGAFKLSDHVGGYYYHGHTVAKLRNGLGAFEVQKNGSLNVGVWGSNLALTSQTVAIRENLPPIVHNGHSQAKSSDNVGTWGLALHQLWHVNRSALGERPDGSLVFEFGNHVTPSTIAHYLIQAGVRDAVMLDMNETWPTGFLYRHTSSGIHGKRINPAIVKSPSIYLQRADKDFVVVSAP